MAKKSADGVQLKPLMVDPASGEPMKAPAANGASGGGGKMPQITVAGGSGSDFVVVAEGDDGDGVRITLVSVPSFKIHPDFGRIPVHLNRLYVLLNGKHCGYVAEEPANAPFFCLASSLDKRLRDRIDALIAWIRGVPKLAPRIDAPSVDVPLDIPEASKELDKFSDVE